MITSRRSAARALSILLALLALVAGCGLAENDSPQLIAPENLPPGLLEPDPDATTTTVDPVETFPATVYLVGSTLDNRPQLVETERRVADVTSPGQRLEALFSTLSDDEEADGLGTSIPSDVVLLDSGLRDDGQELAIDLSAELFDIGGQELINAYAQIVYTATDVGDPRVLRVRFFVEGEEISISNADGETIDGAARRADFSALAPEP